MWRIDLPLIQSRRNANPTNRKQFPDDVRQGHEICGGRVLCCDRDVLRPAACIVMPNNNIPQGRSVTSVRKAAIASFARRAEVGE